MVAARLHQDRYHGEDDRFEGGGGWPPSPGRLFQALVAGAAKGANLLPEDMRALKWLEELEPPLIAAVPGRQGRALQLFVPNNDLDAKGGDPARVAEIRVAKNWRPVFFDSNEPVLYVWDLERESPEAERICEIASCLYQLGRGIDMAWAVGEVMERSEAVSRLMSHPGVVQTPGTSGEIAVPRSGTMDSLVGRYVGKRRRLRAEGRGRKARLLFVQPPKAVFDRRAYDAPPRQLHFELRLPDGRFAPCPLASAAPLSSGLLAAATGRLQESLPGRSEEFERLIRGRGAGPSDLVQRVRLLPIPSIGSPHADPSIRRVLVEIPSSCPIRVDDLAWSFAGVGAYDSRTGEPWSGRLASTSDGRMAERFMAAAHSFRSLTAVALPRASRRRIGSDGRKPAAERSREELGAVSSVFQALRHARIQGRPSGVRVQKEPFIRRGARAEDFAAGVRFSKHALWHVELEFSEPVAGPLVIGDGRFGGLGLMEPVDRQADVIAFDLGREFHLDSAGRVALVGYLRRALMALARERDGGVGPLFSGHELDGRPLGAGHHMHVFLAADCGSSPDEAIRRLVVAAPWAADRRARQRRNDVVRFNAVTRRLRVLRAGAVGRFECLAAELVTDGDPLVGPSCSWIGQTPYVATRNLRRGQDATALLRADVAKECVRRGLPVPSEVEVAHLRSGPRGGRPAARVNLRFATAIRGPVLLGRESHTGGGLFHAAR